MCETAIVSTAHARVIVLANVLGNFTIGFRNRIEGWVTRRADHRVTTEGSQLHNRVHLWVGGSMVPMTSPNDPVFFLHHCFVDKVWADWQAAQVKANPAGAPHYAPMEANPPGHNFEDVLLPWARRIRDVIDIAALGYGYEAPPSVLMADAIRTPFAAERFALLGGLKNARVTAHMGCLGLI